MVGSYEKWFWYQYTPTQIVQEGKDWVGGEGSKIEWSQKFCPRSWGSNR